MRREGARVCVADLNFGEADALAQKIGNGAFAYALNVTKIDEIKACVAECEKRIRRHRHPRQQCRRLRHGAVGRDHREELRLRVRRQRQGPDLHAAGSGRKHEARAGKGGKIINFASQAGRRGEALVAVYCASKAAVISLTQSAGLALIKHGSTSTALRRASSTRRCGSMSTRCSPNTRTAPRARRSASSARAFPWPHGQARGPRRLRRLPRVIRKRLRGGPDLQRRRRPVDELTASSRHERDCLT